MSFEIIDPTARSATRRKEETALNPEFTRDHAPARGLDQLGRSIGRLVERA
ncbi:hypothetical protein HLB23_13335 [Nocardia uniformis]|uniref:Uncharacterized protein n=1 Tax=Nocardia uniformis TaxID=53432 RepID=A0A849C064_9NOCA|nr:hypothetical protein [Nocardia uniformis]NNH70836.1 hypothetical protein [Nocardia uniformis]